MKRKFSFKTYSEVLKNEGIRKHDKHLKEGFLTKLLVREPDSIDTMTQALVEMEIKRNPWYTFRTFLSNKGQDLLCEYDYDIANTIFTNINTWIHHYGNDNNKNDSVLKSLISMVLHKSEKRVLILTPNADSCDRIETRLKELLTMIPIHLVHSYINDMISVESSFNIDSIISYSKNYDIVVSFDLERHRYIDRFIKLWWEFDTKNKQLIITTNEVDFNTTRDGNYTPEQMNYINLNNQSFLMVSQNWDKTLYDINRMKIRQHVKLSLFIKHVYL